MGKPADIPKDVWKVAHAAFWDAPYADDGGSNGKVTAIARAIVAAKAEEHEEKAVLLKAITDIARVDEVDIVLDPHWAIRVAGAAIREARAIRKRVGGAK